METKRQRWLGFLLIPLGCMASTAMAAMNYQGIGGWRTSDGRGGWVQRDDAENRFDIGINACKQACEDDNRCRGVEYISNPNGWAEEGRWVRNKCEIHRDPYAHCDQSGGGRGSADDGCWIKREAEVGGTDCRPYLESFYDTSQRAQSVYGTIRSIRLFHDGNISVGLSGWSQYLPSPAFTPTYNNTPTAFNVAPRNPFDPNRSVEELTARGNFQDFFPSRGDVDLTNLALYRDGRVKITLKEEGDRELYLEDMKCQGNQYEFALEGKVKVAPYTSTWIFTVKRFIDRP